VTLWIPVAKWCQGVTGGWGRVGSGAGRNRLVDGVKITFCG
jgi:hypothetical protein